MSSPVSAPQPADPTLPSTPYRATLHFQQTSLAAIEWDLDFRVIEWNAAAERIFGYTRDEALGKRGPDLIVPEHAMHHVDQVWELLLSRKLLGEKSANENITKSGQIIICEWHNTPLVNEHGDMIAIASLAQDVTERQEIEKRLLYNANHDALTRLPNRALFMRQLERATIHYQKYPSHKTCAVFFIDVDRFKFVNDSLGHSIGDLMLVEIANRLRGCLRSDDIIARLGGDEFAVLIENVSTVDDAIQVAERMQQELAQAFELCGHEVFAGASIGIAFMEDEHDQAEVLLRNADTAMYSAKEAGASSYRVFAPSLHTQASRRLELETDLRWALERQEFQLHYQPIVSLRTQTIIGFEALLRWQHPKRGMVSPVEFIPIAEETGLITVIGEWVLQEACRHLCQWKTRFPGNVPFTVSVNLSTKQFLQPQLIEQVQSALTASNLNPACLKLEITESAIMSSAESATTMLDQLKSLGVQLAIDDFGTGYSSLSYLHRFPFDTLKIDRTFIRQIDTDVEKVELVRTILSLAWNLGMDVVAEGVETKKHLAQLRLLKCDYGQGYLFAKPLNQLQMEELLSHSQEDGSLTTDSERECVTSL